MSVNNSSIANSGVHSTLTNNTNINLNELATSSGSVGLFAASNNNFTTNLLKNDKFSQNTTNNTSFTNFANNSSSTTKDSKSNNFFYCNDCQLSLNSKLTYEQHISGQKHKKKVAQNSIIKSLLEEKKENVYSTQAPSMESSTMETAANINMEQGGSISTASNENRFGKVVKRNKNGSKNQPKSIISQHFKCECCNLTLTSQITYDQHISGQKHQKKLKEFNQQQHQSGDVANLVTHSSEEPLKVQSNQNLFKHKCDICQLSLSSNDQLITHLNGRKHAKKAANMVISNSSSPMDTNTISKIKSESITSNPDTKPTTNDTSLSTTLNPTNTQPIASNFSSDTTCEICSITLPTRDQLNCHLAGKKHLKKLASMSDIGPKPPSKKSKKKEDDDSKFDHLNIAWCKYAIDPTCKKAIEEKFEFYCSLCDKYLQRKTQLVDHLKSSRHHAKIKENRRKIEAAGGVASGKIPSITAEQANNNNNKFVGINKNKRTVGKTFNKGPINFVKATNASSSFINKTNNPLINSLGLTNSNIYSGYNNFQQVQDPMSQQQQPQLTTSYDSTATWQNYYSYPTQAPSTTTQQQPQQQQQSQITTAGAVYTTFQTNYDASNSSYINANVSGSNEFNPHQPINSFTQQPVMFDYGTSFQNSMLPNYNGSKRKSPSHDPFGMNNDQQSTGYNFNNQNNNNNNNNANRLQGMTKFQK